jgi:hypothetical protein
MSNQFQPGISIDSGSVAMFDHIDTDGPMWTGSGPRAVRVEVKFTQPFFAPPAIHMSTSMIDADSSRNLRLSLVAEDCTPHGFTAVAKTWSDSRIGRLAVMWTAIGEGVRGTTPMWDV